MIATSFPSLLIILSIILVVVARPCHGQFIKKRSDADHRVVGNKNGNNNNNNNNNKFVPPKLSFSSSDYYASLRDDNVVTSVQTAEDVEEAPWTIFQASPDAKSIESIRRRSGPLLTLFPDNDYVGKGGGGAMGDANNRIMKHVILDPYGQRAYLVEHSKECYPDDPDALVNRYDLLAAKTNNDISSSSHLAVELWKYCALYVEGGAYVDHETSPLAGLGDALGWGKRSSSGKKNRNYVVMSASRDSGVSPSLLPPASVVGENGEVLSNSTISDAVNVASSRGTGDPIAISSLIAISGSKDDVPRKMIEKILNTDADVLATNALLLPRSLMTYTREGGGDEKGKKTGGGGGTWGYLGQRCSGIEIAPPPTTTIPATTTLRHCPTSAGYCCEILDPSSTYVLLLSRQSLMPNQVLPIESALPVPYRVHVDASSSSTKSGSEGGGGDGGLAFLATVHEVPDSPLLSSTTKGNSESTPNVYEILSGQRALPNQVPNRQVCMDCLREKKASDCNICREKCGIFCEKICEVEVKEKPVKRVVTVSAPRYRKDPERFIPRIVHQVRRLRDPGGNAR